MSIIDSIKVYVKTKEGFGWPEDADEFTPGAADSKVLPSAASTTGGAAVVSAGSGGAGDGLNMQPLPLTAIDRLLASALEVLDGLFATQQQSNQQQDLVSLGLYLDIVFRLYY